jgi:hypothetical protein
VTATRRAPANLARCSLAVERDTPAQERELAAS